MFNKETRYLLPQYWASALINDDYSGLDDEEERKVRNFLEIVPGYPIGVDWDTLGFYHFNDAGTLPADCVEYIFVEDV